MNQRGRSVLCPMTNEPSSTSRHISLLRLPTHFVVTSHEENCQTRLSCYPCFVLGVVAKPPRKPHLIVIPGSTYCGWLPSFNLVSDADDKSQVWTGVFFGISCLLSPFLFFCFYPSPFFKQQSGYCGALKRRVVNKYTSFEKHQIK